MNKETELVQIEILKEKTISNHGRCKAGTVLLVPETAAEVYVNYKIAKLVKKQLTATDIVVIIEKVTTVEDLKQYELDTRQVVVAAYKKKLAELSV